MATKSKSSHKASATKPKPAPSKAAKPTARPVAKPAAKPVAKPAAKPVAKPAAKPVVKPASKLAAKPASKPVAKKKTAPAPAAKPAGSRKVSGKPVKQPVKQPVKPPVKPPVAKSPGKPMVLTGFLAKQRGRLLVLKDTLLDSMNGVAKDSLRSRADGSEASAFGMHQADAGSDAYDRDFALSLLSQEQDSLYEIDEALKRLESGSYGICEISGKAIPHIRLEALPFTRYTVECQAEIEKRNRYSRVRQPVASLFGLGDDDSADEGDDDSSNDSKE